MSNSLTEKQQEQLLEQFITYVQNNSETLTLKLTAWLQGWGDIYEQQVLKQKDIKQPKLTPVMIENGHVAKENLKYSIVLCGALYGIVIYNLEKSKTPIINQLKTYMEEDPLLKESITFYFQNITIGYLSKFEDIKEELMKECELDEIRKLLGLEALNLHLKRDNIK
jgi:hypothetical protein